jgi:hypothetical protein
LKAFEPDGQKNACSNQENDQRKSPDKVSDSGQYLEYFVFHRVLILKKIFLIIAVEPAQVYSLKKGGDKS